MAKIKVQKINGLWGCAPVYTSEDGTIYTQDYVRENIKLFECDAPIKKAKKKKSGGGGSTSNNALGSQVLGEGGYHSQLRERFVATAEFVSRVNEVAL